ncbi:hypothetical protein D3260_02200 [Salinisphaera sp. Q1T1-3]|nr:hypothetical protein D3260_02200 [Salinisphaera sp. Q1T1-3]
MPPPGREGLGAFPPAAHAGVAFLARGGQRLPETAGGVIRLSIARRHAPARAGDTFPSGALLPQAIDAVARLSIALVTGQFNTHGQGGAEIAGVSASAISVSSRGLAALMGGAARSCASRLAQSSRGR